DLYIFQGRYSEIASAPVRNNMRTLAGKLQYLHNSDDMDNLMKKIQKGSFHHFKIEKKSSIIEKLLHYS
ncbi:MAG: hypothetical protein PF518_15435, partial [Spirochaetaceae bacterium]|nr:hypothetical protein [Spirochaetaceae bacterium]